MGMLGLTLGECLRENAKVFGLKGIFKMQVVFGKVYFKNTLENNVCLNGV